LLNASPTLLAQIQSVQALQSFTTPRGGPIVGRSGEKLAAVADNPILFLFERLNRPNHVARQNAVS
jgi:hypothetical protein